MIPDGQCCSVSLSSSLMGPSFRPLRVRWGCESGADCGDRIRWCWLHHSRPLGITYLGGIQLTGLLQISGSPGTRRSRAVQARRVTAASGRHWLDLLGPGVDDEVAVADGRVPDGQLEDAVEHHAAAA